MSLTETRSKSGQTEKYREQASTTLSERYFPLENFGGQCGVKGELVKGNKTKCGLLIGLI